MPEPTPTLSEYLARIGLSESPGTDLRSLTTLQQAHLSNVPFENIDVFNQTGVRTDVQWSLDKIVANGRGGWCFENNGAFGWLLRSLGFTVTYLGAHVMLEPSSMDHMSHLCLRVDLDEPYLVDVGFGDSFTSPIPLDRSSRGFNRTDPYVLDHRDEWVTLFKNKKPRQAQYRFTLVPRALSDFTAHSDRLQQPGKGHFTDKPFATRLLGDGNDRVTLLTDRIKFRRGGQWTEEPVDTTAWNRVAMEWFGLDLS